MKAEGGGLVHLWPRWRLWSTYGLGDVCVWGHTLGTATLVAWRAIMSLALHFTKSRMAAAWKALFEERWQGWQCPLLRGTPCVTDLSRLQWLMKKALTAAAGGVQDNVLGTRLLLSNSRPSIGNLSSYFRRLWIRFILGNHAAEDQWLMNIHEKIHSLWLYLPRGMKYGLLCWRFSLDQKDLWRTYCTEYVLN